MKKVTRIEWNINTSNQEGSGTDANVVLKIFRDGHELLSANLEPGETGRLDRGEHANYYWEFQSPDGLGTAVSGQVVPYTENFPNGISGHLQVRLETKSDDEWRFETIDSYVVSGDMVFTAGTIDDWS